MAAFRFSTKEKSTAAKLGSDENVGVIGMAVFKEKKTVQIAQGASSELGTEAPNNKREAITDNQTAPNATSEETADEGIGTEEGTPVASPANIVPFVRINETTPSEMVVLYYDNQKGLEKRGVVFEKKQDSDKYPKTSPRTVD